MKKNNIPVSEISDMRIYTPHSAKRKIMPYESVNLYENIHDTAPVKIYHHERKETSIEV